LKNAFKIVPVALYFIVGIISLVMAQKSLFSSGFISFHEEAAGMSWEKLDPKVSAGTLKPATYGHFKTGHPFCHKIG